MSTTPEVASIGLMMDLRERMVRIETKLDSQSEKAAETATCVEEHGERLATLERDAASLRSQVATVKWIGGGLVTVATLFGDHISRLFG